MGEFEVDPEFYIISEATSLDIDQIMGLKKGFEGFDKEGAGTITTTTMQMILKSMGTRVEKDEIESAAQDLEGTDGDKFKFSQFCTIAARFMTEDDEEQMREELKEAFRIYDKEGNGYITTEVLKEIIQEIDPTLTEEDLDGIIDEVDEDGSGTLDFDEFQEMMMG